MIVEKYEDQLTEELLKRGVRGAPPGCGGRRLGEPCVSSCTPSAPRLEMAAPRQCPVTRWPIAMPMAKRCYEWESEPRAMEAQAGRSPGCELDLRDDNRERSSSAQKRSNGRWTRASANRAAAAAWPRSSASPEPQWRCSSETVWTAPFRVAQI
jgi:hypothetical protein